MKKDIHPDNYRLVVFKDVSNDKAFLTRSCAPSKETIKWEDGNEYPMIKLEISSYSHPFFTGKMKFVDTAGRIDKFNKKFSKSRFARNQEEEEKGTEEKGTEEKEKA
jgi:large subunit ribosomal protein L31